MPDPMDFYKKAYTLEEIDNAVRFDVPINADHPFYTDFSKVRGDFEDRLVYRSLNLRKRDGKHTFNAKANPFNKQALFLAGMRGSGKTSELAKYVKNLHHSDAFFCVVCNLDSAENGLDLNDMEYMDILIFQTERLIQELKENEIIIDNGILEQLQSWFQERVNEVNKIIKTQGGIEVALKTGTPKGFSFFSFLDITAKLKANITGSKQNAQKIREVFRNNFSDFAGKFNIFTESVNTKLREEGLGQEVLFIVDGLEKTASTDIRKKIIIDDNERFKQIKTYTIFTLPIELMNRTRKLYAQGNHVISFPFVKLQKRDGSIIDEAVEKFTEFVYKRIDQNLFDSSETVRTAILYSGGSPRELLRILEFASILTDEGSVKIDFHSLEKALDKLAGQASQHLTEEDIEILRKLRKANEKAEEVLFDEGFQRLMEDMIVLEYNDGNYRRVHPLIERSKRYKQYVIN